MVTRTVLFGVVLVGLMACGERSSQPIQMAPHGTAVRANLAAHIINPIPPGDAVTPSDAARSGLAIGAYRTGEVKDPKEEAGESTTSDVN